MKIIVALFAVLLFSGCAGYKAARTVIYSASVDLADQGLADALILICDAPTAGALRRRWGGNTEAIDAWQEFCSVSRRAVAPE